MIPKLRAVLGRWPFPAGDPHRNASGVGGPGSRSGGRPGAADEGLKYSRLLLQSVADNSAAVIFVKDLEGRFLLINRRFEELFGVSRDDVAGKTDFDLFPVDHAAAFRAFDRRVLAAGK